MTSSSSVGWNRNPGGNCNNSDITNLPSFFFLIAIIITKNGGDIGGCWDDPDPILILKYLPLKLGVFETWKEREKSQIYKERERTRVEMQGIRESF